MTTFVAFLRGINVGGKSIISMVDLKACFETLGYTNVRTYINSGNVIFQADGDKQALEADIEAALLRQFKAPITAMVRSQKDIEHLLAHLPDQWQTTPGHIYEFIFLSKSIDSPELLKTIPVKTEIEELLYSPGALLWFFEKAAKTRSSVIKINQMPIYQQMSVRTSGTVRKIAELMQ
jgi:uncharacterized protein (DUF1697 family)